MVASEKDNSDSVPVFRRCVRCGYSLRHLPAEHACPECGLRFDRQCALYRVTNEKQVLIVWGAIFLGGWINLKHLRFLSNLEGASAWEKFLAIVALVWVIVIAIGIWFFAKRYRQGFEVAIVSDGLLIKLPGFNEDIIPWNDVENAAIKDQKDGKPQVARVTLKRKNKTIEIGGVGNVFPTREDVESFVDEVNRRVRLNEE